MSSTPRCSADATAFSMTGSSGGDGTTRRSVPGLPTNVTPEGFVTGARAPARLIVDHYYPYKGSADPRSRRGVCYPNCGDLWVGWRCRRGRDWQQAEMSYLLVTFRQQPVKPRSRHRGSATVGVQREHHRVATKPGGWGGPTRNLG